MNLHLNWRARVRKFRDSLTNKALVLMYHRVGNLTNDPWQLAVSPENFEQQLRVLKETCNLISVGQLIEQIGKKSIAPKSVCLTFDDGYRDNYFAAKPLLEKYDCPATFFIATHYISRQQPFWWDELEQVILRSEKLPSTLSMTFNQTPFEFKLENGGVLTAEESEKQKSWVWNEEFPTQRCELYLTLYKILRYLPYDEQQSVIEKIKLWGDHNKNLIEDFAMTEEQLKEMANHPQFEIGLHTATHPFLAAHSREIQSKEIIACENYLKNNCPNYTRILAYPHGDFNEVTLSVVKEKNLTAAFTTSERPVTKHSNLYDLGRFQVKNWNEEEFARLFLN